MDINMNVLDIKKMGIEPLANDEIFVQVHNTINYWVSNYGRLVNNLRKNYYLHKTGDVHWTIQNYYIEGVKTPLDTYPCDVVAEHFLEKVKDKNRIWHIDGNTENNYYKNLIYVDGHEYHALNIGILSVHDLGRLQEYIPYITAKNNRAYVIYNAIVKRCYDPEFKSKYPHYEDAFMCEGWRNDPDLFEEWYESNYYEVYGESMQVDKDLLYPGNKEYHPLKCVIIPQGLNSMLSNSKKHYFKNDDSVLGKKNNNLPLGVRYDRWREKYFSQITMDGETITLGYWDTPDEAFNEYKRHKEAYILIMADRYKNKVPKQVYDSILKITVEPF